MNTITPQQYKQNTKALQASLRKFQQHDYHSVPLTFSGPPTIGRAYVLPYIELIVEEITKTTVDAGGKKGLGSTASRPAYNRVWTVGSLGSVWVDIKIPGSPVTFRIGFDPKNSSFHINVLEPAF
jgi:hypothetical protein